jgi:hypothetical protein
MNIRYMGGWIFNISKILILVIIYYAVIRGIMGLVKVVFVGCQVRLDNASIVVGF